jgi:hypothetical protein
MIHPAKTTRIALIRFDRPGFFQAAKGRMPAKALKRLKDPKASDCRSFLFLFAAIPHPIGIGLIRFDRFDCGSCRYAVGAAATIQGALSRGAFTRIPVSPSPPSPPNPPSLCPLRSFAAILHPPQFTLITLIQYDAFSLNPVSPCSP